MDKFQTNKEYIEQLAKRYFTEGREALGSEFLIKKEDLTTPSGKRLILAEALSHYNKFLEFTLFDKEIVEKWYNMILQQDVERFTQMRQKDFSFNQNNLIEEVSEDIVFGYCLKLTENLMPYQKNIS